jgi:hypothetical protein
MVWFTIKVGYWMMHCKIHAALREMIIVYGKWIDACSTNDLGIVAQGSIITNG